MKAKRIIGFLLFSLFLLGLQAQDRYEHATLAYTLSFGSKYKLSVSYEGKFEKTEGTVPEGTSYENMSPVLEYLNKLSKEGWENYSNTAVNNSAYTVLYFSLRRKKN